jgi:UDP-glucose 4-epimerase
MQRLVQGRPPIFHSHPLSSHDYVHVDDVARANLIAAEAPSRALGQPYVIASGASTTHQALAALLCELAGIDSEPVWIGKEKSPVVVRYDPAAAAERLGWRVQVPLRDGLSAMLAGVRSSQ